MPDLLNSFKEKYPDTWSAYEQLKTSCDRQGPLDVKTVELVKISVSTALEHKGGLIAHISQARKAGANEDEIYHAILLATGLAGFPAVLAAFGTALEYLGD
ncbi:MAG: carboxymuconolactone decarboxylase family protein [Gammaproteobacteria bacterium]